MFLVLKLLNLDVSDLSSMVFPYQFQSERDKPSDFPDVHHSEQLIDN